MDKLKEEIMKFKNTILLTVMLFAVMPFFQPLIAGDDHIKAFYLYE